ncbi:MAG: Hpt domain-containing protein [Dongiaceae bacterium]
MSVPPVIDPELVQEAKQAMKSKFPMMVEYYLEDAHAYIQVICSAYREQNAAKLLAPAHTLKSSSRQMGALQLSELAREIETLTRAVIDGGPQLKTLEDKIARLNSYFQAVEQALREDIDGA